MASTGLHQLKNIDLHTSVFWKPEVLMFMQTFFEPLNLPNIVSEEVDPLVRTVAPQQGHKNYSGPARRKQR